MVAPAFNMTVLRTGAQFATSEGGPSISPATAAPLWTPQPGEKLALAAGAHSLVIHSNGDPWNQLALLYTDLTSADTIRVRASGDPTMATGIVLDTGATAPWTAPEQAGKKARPNGYRHFFYQSTALIDSFRFTRIDFNLAGARTLGRLMIGPAIQPEFNADYQETAWGYEEGTEPELLDSGVEVLYETTPAPVMKFRLSWLTEAEMNADWEPLGRLQHTGEPVLVARRPDPHDDRHNGLYYGRLRMTPLMAADFDMYEVAGQVRSMI